MWIAVSCHGGQKVVKMTSFEVFLIHQYVCDKNTNGGWWYSISTLSGQIFDIHPCSLSACPLTRNWLSVLCGVFNCIFSFYGTFWPCFAVVDYLLTGIILSWWLIDWLMLSASSGRHSKQASSPSPLPASERASTSHRVVSAASMSDSSSPPPQKSVGGVSSSHHSVSIEPATSSHSQSNDFIYRPPILSALYWS